jgi:rubredoxin---NAD+ reductase
MSQTPVIVIGTGVAGWSTVREFRKLDTQTPVVLVTTDRGDFYAKPTLSNAYAQKRGPAQLVTTPAASMAQTLQVTLLSHARVERLDTKAQTLELRQGDTLQTLAYRQLVLATGAHPIRIPLQGDAAGQVRSINTLDDFAAFHTALGIDSAQPTSGKAKTVLIMGAGLIGCEFANDLAQSGVRVHVVDPALRPLAALLPQAASEQLQAALNALGVQWHFGTSVAAVQQGVSGLLLATLADGSTVETDQVLSAIGLRADTGLAQAAGLVCERGIVVNSRLATSAPAVYALGDCAQYDSAGQRTLPYVMPVMAAARALAATLAGTPTELVFPLMPVSIKTPALPIVVAAAHPATQGHWLADKQEGAWSFLDASGVQRGFALTGKSTTRRMEMVQRTVLEAKS